MLKCKKFWIDAFLCDVDSKFNQRVSEIYPDTDGLRQIILFKQIILPEFQNQIGIS